jgi:glycosyltransferase involved in cell wall biosynthesis
MRYLLITHIPFARNPGGEILVDRLWAEDLRGLVNAVGPITVAAPEVLRMGPLQAWGPSVETLQTRERMTFVGLPERQGRLDMTHRLKLKSLLRKAVKRAEIVHTSNLFEPNTNLYFAHDYAVKRGKKTLFVVAEDFYDMMEWEWVRTAPTTFQRVRRHRALERIDYQVRRRVATASLTFLHTPAAVTRYRQDAMNGVAIRQPMHEREDVIAAGRLSTRLFRASTGTPLRLVTASRMQPLKGLDLLLRAIALLESRGIEVEATLCGDGPQLLALRALAQQLQIATRVQFPGPVTPALALRECLANGDLFLMPHLTHDFGRSFFDAMAAGCPVVAFRSVASQDTVRDGVDGLLAPNADVEGLAACIGRFHHDRELLARASQAARVRALENTRTFWNNFRGDLVRELLAETAGPGGKT